MRIPWIPREMLMGPILDESIRPGPIKSRYALLINPFYAKDPYSSFGKHVLTPSISLTSVAASTPEHWEVRYWDENLGQGPPPWEPFPEVVGITVHLTFAKRAYELAGWYRRRGAKVILGGLHVTSCPDEAVDYGDAIAIGEGVQLWPQILGDIERGALQGVYRGSYKRPYGEEPIPRREILPRESFLTTSSVIASRGCHNRCSFCYLATNGLHMPYQVRDVEQIVEEIRRENQPYTVFIDNNLGSRSDYLRNLCSELRRLEIIWSAAVTLDITDDPTLVREMALAGCTGVFVGFESLIDENLAYSRKKCPRVEEYGRRVKILHDYGIQVNGSFVFGFDHDTREVFERTADWIEDNRLECATFHILTPYPGTPLFRQMEKEGRLLHKDWSLYDTAHVVFRPRRMTAEELAEGYSWSYRRLFSHRSIWRRRPQSVRAVLPYLAMCYLYKRSNRIWPFLIGHRLTGLVWGPLIECSRRRHLRYRRRLIERESKDLPITTGTVLSAGV
ncbi:MAG: B12-binding domain-containing radical SAM protein [Planctomycetota bacterium]